MEQTLVTPKTLPLVEELDPLLFCRVWGLSYEAASSYLHVGARTLAAYASNGKKTKRNPSTRVKALAAMKHNEWVSTGKPPVEPNLLFFA